MSSQKIALIRAKLTKWGVDALLLSSATNRRWATQFTGSFGYVLISQRHALLATDGRYWVQADEQSPAYDVYKYERKDGALAEFITLAAVTSLAIEGEHVTLSEFSRMRKAPNVKFKALGKTVEPMRDVKSADEIAKIRAAAAITDYAMAQVNELIKPGMTERAIAWELEKLMRERGADGLAFETIVASGPNGSRPHHRPSARQVTVGDAITIDMGASLHGYHSDLTRTFHLGDNPSDRFWEVYTTVLDAHDNAYKRIKPGMTGVEADKLARDVIDAAGFAADFKHSLGHGVGLEIHEGPRLSRTSNDPIPVGAVVTIEPGVYIDNWSGMRIEDLVVITESGAETISQCPKIPVIPVYNA